MIEWNQAKAERIIISKRKRKVYNGWIMMTQYLKSLKTNQNVLKQNLAFMKLKKGMEKWRLRNATTQTLRRKETKTVL
jgi:hypothetical protein